MASERRGRGGVALATLTALALTAGCGGGDEPDDGAAPSAPASSAAEGDGGSGASGGADPSATPTQVEVADPCEALTPEQVAELLDLPALEERSEGVASARGCSYLEDGADVPVLAITTLAAWADFEDIWDEVVGEIEEETREVEVPGADAARIIVSTEDDALRITGAVGHGRELNLVNVALPEPYDAQATEAAIEVIMTRLVATESSPSASPTTSAPPGDASS